MCVVSMMGGVLIWTRREKREGPFIGRSRGVLVSEGGSVVGFKKRPGPFKTRPVQWVLEVEVGDLEPRDRGALNRLAVKLNKVDGVLVNYHHNRFEIVYYPALGR